MRPLRLFCLAAALSAAAICQTVDVGIGAPNETLRSRFVNAFYRNGFAYLVALPPLGAVKAFGSTGLVQEFNAKTGTGRLALVKANTGTALAEDIDFDVFQVQAGLYSYYTSIGVGTVGYPTTDSLACPPGDNPCQYQLFDKSYALFAFQNVMLSGQNFALHDPPSAPYAFYTKWTAAGGISALGAAVSQDGGLTSSFKTTATGQTFTQGAIYRITSGFANGQMLAVQQPVWGLYSANGAHSGFLGFPVSEDLTLAGGRHRQTFEGGAIEYTPGGEPAIRYAVASVAVAPDTASLRMDLGQTVTLNVTAFASNGTPLTDRVFSWTSSNTKVVAIQTSGGSATLKAVGGGVATVTAASEGKSIRPIVVVVTAPCCQLGEGAPGAAVAQAMASAVARNRVDVALPASGAARRVGAGYVQEVMDTAVPPVRYLIAKADNANNAYLLSGELLARYLEFGGPAGAMGYPISDRTPGGRQMFDNGALAGSPVYPVSGAVLFKWAAAGYETGPAGVPSAEQAGFLTFLGTSGTSQAFQNAIILAPRRGRVFLLARGPILLKYLTTGGATGSLGLPVGEETVTAGRHRQEFEGGSIEYAEGDAEARVTERERHPAVGVVPGTVLAGTTARIVISGFEAGAVVRVSISQQPDFQVRTSTGAYVWETFVPATASSGTVGIRAVSGAASAEGSYQVKALKDVLLKLTKTSGDLQTGGPGALLPQPMRVALRDEAGNPVPGVLVNFAASPGSRAEPASALTDANGNAETRLRLQANEGVALLTAEAARGVVTFSARATAFRLANFPSFSQPAGAGALLAAAASIVRYYQDQSLLAKPNGPADLAGLKQFLESFCAVDSQGARLCDGFLQASESGGRFANLWRLGAYTGGGLEVAGETPGLDTIRYWLSQGTPMLLALSLSASDGSRTPHFVSAVGVMADGGIEIKDPDPVFARAALTEYLTGFSAAGQTWKGTLTGAVRITARMPASTGFIAFGASSFQLRSPDGDCGAAIEWPDVSAGSFHLRYCDGARPVYQLDVAAEGVYRMTVIDLADQGSRFDLGGSGAASYRIARPAALLAVAPQDVSVAPGAVVNAASFRNEIAPGTLISIFGGGLAREGAATVVEMDGAPVTVVAATPFQINAQAPLDLTPGDHSLRIKTPYGAAEQPVAIQETAPAIFVLDSGRAAVVNQDGTLNSPSNPARRGQTITVYCTGLGAVTPKDSLQEARTAVKVLLEGTELPAVIFAGLSPGSVGLYQVNVVLPPGMSPNQASRLMLLQGQTQSNAVEVAVQ